ncbi:MAG: hypothetical protein HY736_06735 [Verrucomicrobia bacterium]|nr:hypothetical protein [Verrucomicrobiota bacterium]
MPTRKVHPGFDFSWMVPVNQRFGFTLSAGSSTNHTAQDSMQNTWHGVSAATNGGTFPNTTVDRPYLSQYIFCVNATHYERHHAARHGGAAGPDQPALPDCRCAARGFD